MSINIALVGYPSEYFLPFAQALESAGFQVYWISALSADKKYLIKNRVDESRVLNILDGFRITGNIEQCKQKLSHYEGQFGPMFADIIMMDRLLCKKDWRFSVEFLSHVAEFIELFVKNNNIQIMSSWRDTCVQLTAMLVAKSLHIPCVIPTRIRIPQEMYGFCTEYHTDSFIQIRKPTEEDYTWAKEFIKAFENRQLSPALKKASRSFLNIISLLPSHFRAFAYELRRSFSDIGNDYTRYPIPRLMFMYAERRVNLLRYKLFSPAKMSVDFKKDFCLFALHTQPESSIDVQASYFSNQLELIRTIARSLPMSHTLYVKVHPTDVDGKSIRFYKNISEIPNVELLNFSVNSMDLLNRAQIVFALTGTIAYEAGLLQKNVIVFVKNYFNRLPSVKYCSDFSSLPHLINKLISENNKPKDSTREQIVEFIAKIRACCYAGEVSRTYGASNEPLRGSDLETVTYAYKELCEVLKVAIVDTKY